jgi:hypothetical protein
MRHGPGAVGCPAVRLILAIIFRTVLAVLLTVALAVLALRVRNVGGRGDHFEAASARGRMAYLHSAGGRLTLMSATPWPRQVRPQWLSGTGDDWARDSTSGVAMWGPASAWQGWQIVTISGRGQALAPRSHLVTTHAPDVQFFMASAPHWLVAAVTASPALAWLALVVPKRVRLRRRKRLGLCLACGYDLWGSPGRCPECGTEPQPSSSVTPTDSASIHAQR